jgi:alpha-beta hydrolase superfamily lysophospholipase
MAGFVGLCAFALATLSGPLFPFKAQPSDMARAVAQAADLDLYLREGEAQHAGVRPQLAKGIVWRDPVLRGRTSVSLVYLHGFSASRKDIAPVVEMAAGEMQANAFFTRLAAHGLDNPGAFATVTPQDWLDDAREALAIGRRIGDRTVLIGISTGALLATIVALEQQSPTIAALVLLSPNFALRDWRAQFLSGPLGPLLARIALGSDHSFRPENPRHGEFWTSRYPSRGVVALMDLVNRARALRLAELQVPTLTVYTEHDTVVDVGVIRARHAEIGAPRKRIVDLPAGRRHELTGAALAPETVEPVVHEIVDFLSSRLDG